MANHAEPQFSQDMLVQKDGYELTFYPGFASRCVVRTPDGRELEMYRQTSPFPLPAGESRPRDRHRVDLRGGTGAQQVSFDVHDPKRRVKRIIVELYAEDHQPGERTEEAGGDVLTMDNDTIYCPPHCDQETFDRLRNPSG